jgi:AcrR family transcriptional regulator
VVSTQAPRRADAVRNLDRVVKAAHEVFVARGLDATVEEIAARAGVGKATVYRNFPTRADLMATTALHRLSWFDARLREALEEDDVAVAVRRYVHDAFEQLRIDRGLGDVLRSLKMPAVVRAARALRVLGEQLVARGVAAGVLRPDASGDDLHLLVSSLNRALVERGTTRRAEWQHAADLVLRALER